MSNNFEVPPFIEHNRLLANFGLRLAKSLEFGSFRNFIADVFISTIKLQKEYLS